MKLIIKRNKYESKKNYYCFNLIEICYINTFQVVSLNITLLNIFIQLIHEKRRK